MYKIICLIIFVIFNFTNSTFICSSNHTVKLPADEIFFFQSTNYLNHSINLQNEQFCQINFVLDSIELVTNKRFYLVLTNIIDLIEKEPQNMIEIVKNQTFYSFQNSFMEESFQGFAIFDDWGDNSCPLESISRIQPFHFLDENQIITLNSSYFSNFTRKHPCFRHFTAPSGFGFKIVFTHLSNSLEFKIENSTDILWTKHNVKTFHPYYNVDNYLQISLPLATTNYSNFSEIEFSAYITVVKKDWTNTNCTVLQIPTHWTTPFGYSNNERCHLELPIPPNMEVIVHPKLDFEKGVDYLQYFDSDGGKYILESDTVLFGDKTENKSFKNVSFELISDGSIRKGGFDIGFKYFECQCANSNIIIDCEATFQRYYLMKDNKTDYENTGYYCGNLNCSFTIKPNKKCPNKFISLEIILTFEKEMFDSFRIYTNNTVTTEIAYLSQNNWNFYTILSPFVENVFHAITQPSTDASKLLTLIFTPIERPKIHAIILTSEMTDYDARLFFQNYLITVELSPELVSKGYKIEAYGDLNDVTFYENENLARRIDLNKCPHTVYQNECLMAKNKVIAYLDYLIKDDPSFLLFHAANRNFNNCKFYNDVFYLDNRIKNAKSGLSVFASDKGICKIILLTRETTISKLWTTAQNAPVIVYSGSNNEKLFEFNKSTAHSWKQILPFRHFYIFEIPANASLLLSLETDASEEIIADVFPYKTIINFPFTSEYQNSSQLPFLFRVENFDVKLSLIKYNVSDNYEMFLIFKNRTRISFSNIDEIVIPAPEKFIILFEYTSNITNVTWDPNVIVYLETINNFLPTISTTSIIDYDKTSTTPSPEKNNTVSKCGYSMQLILLCFYIFSINNLFN